MSIILILHITMCKCLKQVFRSAHRHELETRLSHKPWTQEISKVTDWPRRMAVAEFRLCDEHDCLGTHLHRNGIRPDPYCTLCSLHEPMDRNHLGHCTGWPGQRWWKIDFVILLLFCDYSLALGLYIYFECFFFFSFFKCNFFLCFTFIGRIGKR